MARPLRIEYPNAFYHVMNRGNSRQAIYQDDDDYEVFLETLEEACKLFGIRVLAYCLMPDHYHLLLTTPKANLSRAMRYINGVYTQRFNKLNKKDGHLFRGRYKAILVQEDEYLTHLIRYIHLNPVQANLARDPKNYPWSSHRPYLKAKNKDPWLFVLTGLSFFADKRTQALKAYREFIDQGIDPKTRDFYSGKRQSSILGDSDFLSLIKEKYLFADKKLQAEIPERRRLSGQAMSKRILKEVSRDFKTKENILYASKRGMINKPRLMAITLTRDLSGLTLPEIAPIFNLDSYKSVGSACHRMRAYLTMDTKLKNRFVRLYQTCSQKET